MYVLYTIRCVYIKITRVVFNPRPFGGPEEKRIDKNKKRHVIF